MNTLRTAFLISSISLAVSLSNTYAQNAADNSSNSNSSNARRAPTIEDRLAQLEQDQQDLTGRVDTLHRDIASLQQEIKNLEGQSTESNGHSAKAATGAVNETPSTTNDVAAQETNGAAGASYDLFYDRLQSDGQWFNDPTYGSVWQPNVSSTDQQWRPYTDGRWVYTDRGWTWISNENFGWATYHYGRWARLSERGWVWVPGSTWAPAWVSWRQSDEYVGWAPLPPETESEQGVKIEAWANTYYNIGPGSYVFLKTTDLGNPSYRGFIASSHDDLDIISRTKNVTSIYYGKTGVIDNGPDYDQLVRDANVKVDRYRLNYVQQNNPAAQFSATTQDNQLQVVAPAPRLQRTATVEPKIADNIANAQVDRGWQEIDQSKAKQLKQAWEKQAPVPASLPAKPAPPKPLFARASGQSQGTSQQPATQNQQPASQNNEANPNPPSTQRPAQRPNDETAVAPAASPSPNERAGQPGQQPSNANRNQRQNVKQGERQESMPPAPSPSPIPNERAAGQQPPNANENRPQEPNQAERPETTPPAPTPSENERPTRQPDRRVAAPRENRGQPQGERERAQPTPSRAESPQPKNARPAQSEEKRPGGENLDQEAPGATERTDEKGGLPQKGENTTRQLNNGEETPKSEAPQREDNGNPRKSNVEERERPASGEKKSHSRDQSGSEKPGGKKRSDEPEKKKVGPSEEE
jgi:hypothetical protein